jgi:uncharacterized RDD family membrane protein YckC
VEYASLGSRAAAVVIDGVILSIGWILLVGIGFAISDAVGGVMFLVSFVASIGYAFGLEATRGATPGKRLMRIKVVRADGGSPIGWTASIVRNLLRIVDGIACYLVGYLVASSSPQRQRIGDKAAGTIVVRQ